MSGHCIISIYGFTMDYCIMDIATMRKVSLLCWIFVIVGEGEVVEGE
jgi:hypothetical protein